MPGKILIDNDNRLILRCNRKDIPLCGFFSNDSKNRLVYWLNEPSVWRKKYKLPEKIVFTGNWLLNENYDLALKVRKNGDSPQKAGTVPIFEDVLYLKGEIISCEGDKLVFELKSVNKNGLTQFKLLKLSGIWQADEFNRISFVVNKKSSPDTLIFQGDWKLNRDQQVIYTYEKTDLKTKTKVLSTLTFRGFWQVSSANRLSYILSCGANSKFDFKVQIETPSIYPKEGVIKYRIGIGAKELKPDKFRIISLFGVWKLNRVLGINFDMEYAKGEIYSLTFGAEVNFDKKNQVVFGLRSKSGENLRTSLIFTHRFLKQLDAELFARLKLSQKEPGVDIGLRIPF